MRVGIIQSNYIPWRGYFDFIDSVDLFIFYDTIQYTKQNWRNRNRIKTNAGEKWLTVPVRHKNLHQNIDETFINYETKWPREHIRKIREAYAGAPYLEDYITEYGNILTTNPATISELNQRLIRWILKLLNITTPIVNSSDFPVSGKSTERLIALLRRVGATSYLSGPSAAAYLDYDLFRKAGVNLEFKSYDYPEYPQLHGGFSPAVTVLDLLFNTGPMARTYLKSRLPDRLIVDCGARSGRSGGCEQ